MKKPILPVRLQCKSAGKSLWNLWITYPDGCRIRKSIREIQVTVCLVWDTQYVIITNNLDLHKTWTHWKAPIKEFSRSNKCHSERAFAVKGWQSQTTIPPDLKSQLEHKVYTTQEKHWLQQQQRCEHWTTFDWTVGFTYQIDAYIQYTCYTYTITP